MKLALLILAIIGECFDQGVRGKAHERRTNLSITHMQLVGEEESNTDDPYAIPDVMLHNRQLSRVTGSPQGGATDYSDVVSPETNISRSSRTLRGGAYKAKKRGSRSPSDPLVATQELPSLQYKQPTNRMQLSRAWATRLEKGSGFKGPLRGGSKERELIHCQCNFQRKRARWSVDYSPKTPTGACSCLIN